MATGRVVTTPTYSSRAEQDNYTVLVIELPQVRSRDVSSDATGVALPGGTGVLDDGSTAAISPRAWRCRRG
jgi:hypothetical protein